MLVLIGLTASVAASKPPESSNLQDQTGVTKVEKLYNLPSITIQYQFLEQEYVLASMDNQRETSPFVLTARPTDLALVKSPSIQPDPPVTRMSYFYSFDRKKDANIYLKNMNIKQCLSRAVIDRNFVLCKKST